MAEKLSHPIRETTPMSGTMEVPPPGSVWWGTAQEMRDMSPSQYHQQSQLYHQQSQFEQMRQNQELHYHMLQQMYENSQLSGGNWIAQSSEYRLPQQGPPPKKKSLFQRVREVVGL